MATRHKLTLINGMIDTEGGIQILRAANSFKVGGCEPGWYSRSSLALSQ